MMPRDSRSLCSRFALLRLLYAPTWTTYSIPSGAVSSDSGCDVATAASIAWSSNCAIWSPYESFACLAACSILKEIS